MRLTGLRESTWHCPLAIPGSLVNVNETYKSKYIPEFLIWQEIRRSLRVTSYTNSMEKLWYDNQSYSQSHRNADSDLARLETMPGLAYQYQPFASFYPSIDSIF